MVFNCLSCHYQTELKYNFQKHLKTNKHFLAIQNEEKMLQNEEKKEKKEPISTIYTSKYSCQWCNRQYSRNDNLQRHHLVCYAKNHHIAPKDHQNEEESMRQHKYICQICNNSYKHQRSLSRHFANCVKKNEQILEVKHNLDNSKEIVESKQQTLNGTNCLQYQNSFYCSFCHNCFQTQKGLSYHQKKCYTQIQQLENLKNENEKLQLLIEKEQAINQEKEKAIEIAKKSNTITINNTSNKTINFLNSNYGEMIVMEQFLRSLEHTHQLTLQERKDLLNAYHECGIDVFSRNFSYIMKQNCKRQLEAQGIEDMKLLPLFCSDGNLRSHKEKQEQGWKTQYDNNSINRMINISNQQIHESYKRIVPISGKERNRVFNEIKKDNHQNKLKV